MVTVSVCMIVKNEELVLERCLKSIQPIADEIIIVDTGSTDATKQIAARYTDQIFEFAWTGSFSDARNFSFSKASKDFIYTADADEEMDEQNIAKFQMLKQAMLPEIEIVQMWYENCNDVHTTENFRKSYRPKLYRRLRTFFWDDPVHEMVRMTPVVFDSDITVMHKPVGEHAKRDLDIFHQMAQKDAPMSERLRRMYARELYMAGNDEELSRAQPFFKKQQESVDSKLLQMKESGIIQAKNARIKGDFAAFLKNALKDMLTEPSAEMCVELGTYFESLGDYEEAILWYYNAAFETECLMDARCGGEIPQKRLSVCYNMLADSLPNECETDKKKYREIANNYDKMAENSR